MKKTGTSLISLLFLSLSAGAQPRTDGNDITFHSSRGNLRISMVSTNTFRVSKSVDSRMPENEPWMVERYDFPQVDYSVSDSTITTSRLQIKVTANPWRIEVSNRNGRTLYRETHACAGDSVSNTACMAPDEHFFGLGERMDFLDQRGQRVHLDVGLGHGPKPAVGGKDILRANYCPVPLLLSNKGYAIFFHTAVPNDWDLGWTDREHYSFSASGGDNDYYFIMGPDMEQLIRSYQTLTGRAPLMPRPAYGLHIGSYSGGTWKYERNTSDTYVVNLIRRLRNERIPFDLMWLDSTWRNFTTLGNGGCSFEFQDTFKDPKAMVDSATANHVSLFGLHVRSLIDNGRHNHLLDEARKKGFTIQDGHSNAIINFFDERATDWWWDMAARRVTGIGVKFFKTDVGSALRFDHPTPAQQALHNLFPIAYARAPYVRFARLNGQRGFGHTREGYAGIQRYPFIWAGDWGSEWQWFEPVVRGGLNIGLSGVGYWSHCMGGFEQYSPYDTDLYIRWTQMGMFSPVSILFGMDHPRYHAPWTYGPEAERIFIRYDSLRYTLLPYIYTAAHDMYVTSRPLMAPLLMDYTTDELTYRISDQYLFGRDLMVCPVTTKGALSRPVYFPGGQWIDFWTGERISGRQHKSFLTPVDIMPIFIRQGAIIPQQEAMQYVDEKPVSLIRLLIYPSEHSSYRLYEDDGRSTDYQQGGYAQSLIESRMTNGRWTLCINRPEGRFKPSVHTYEVNVYLDYKPGCVTVNGRPLTEGADGWTYDSQLRRVHIPTGLTNHETINVEVLP